MGKLFHNDPTEQAASQRQELEARYSGARHNILLILAFTVINIILLVTNSNTYFLFSAYIPYVLADLGMFLCGMYPVEYYDAEFAGMDFLGKGFFAAMMVIAGVILVLYLLCWIFSKKQKMGWLIFALVFFCVDTGIMLLLNGISSDMIVDIIFHGWVIVSLFRGISACSKLKKLPEDQDLPIAQADSIDEPVLQQQD